MSYFDDNEDYIIYGGRRAGRRSKNSAQPGSPLAKARMRAHAAFDPTWQSGKMTRTQAYKQLAQRLGLHEKDCHMLLFTIEMCDKVTAMYTLDDFEAVE